MKLSSRIGTVTVALSLAFACLLNAQDDKKKTEHKAPPAHHQSAPSGGNHQSSTPPSNQSTTHQTPQTPHVATPSGNQPPQNSNSPRQYGGQNATHPTSGNPNPGGQPGGQNGNVPHNVTPGGQNTNVPHNVTPGNQPRQFGGQTPGNSVRPGNSGSGVYTGRNTQPGGYSGAQVVRTRSGGEIHRDAGGQIREVHTPGGAVIHHAPDGIRRVEVVRPGGRVVVANTRGGYGYVQRPLVVNNVTYVQRTYVVGGRSYARVYRPWVWGGVSFAVYTPTFYYRPAFYTWAYNPWARPVAYSWGWGGSPWYGYYGAYFTPYPVYAGPAFWLTDFLLSATLEEAYQARVAAAANAQAYPPPGGQVAMTPDVKQAISDEVRRQLDQERAEQGMQQGAANGPPPLFSGNGPHVFVVSSGLQVADGGMGCPLTEGDVIQMNAPPQQNSPYANVVVLASKGPDCRKGSQVQVALNDLQEMQNQMRATIDRGLGDLQSKQGQGGLPQMPATAAGAPTNAPFAAQVKPDDNVASEINQAANEANRAEQDVVNEAPTAPAAPTTSISLGMSIADVERAMGNPRETADLGAKKIYVYPSMKITFIDGRVTDVQ